MGITQQQLEDSIFNAMTRFHQYQLENIDNTMKTVTESSLEHFPKMIDKVESIVSQEKTISQHTQSCANLTLLDEGKCSCDKTDEWEDIPF